MKNSKRSRAGLPEPKQFTLDGEPCDLAELYVVNDLEPEVCNRIAALAVGESMALGGGAGADFILKREE